MHELVLHLKSHAGKTHGMLQALRSVMLPAEFETGFVASCLYNETSEPDSLCYVEEWASEADLERTICSARFGRLMSVIETARGTPTLIIRLISETRGWDYVRLLRGDDSSQGQNGDKLIDAG